MRAVTARLDTQSQSLFHHEQCHVRLVYPHDNMSTHDSNTDLLDKIKATAPYLTMQGGIHFDCVLELRQHCNFLLTTNEWSTRNEEEIAYTRNMNRLIQEGMMVFGCDCLVSKQVIDNGTFSSDIEVKFKDITYLSDYRNHTNYTGNLDEITRHCLKCGSSLHCTFEHESTFIPHKIHGQYSSQPLAKQQHIDLARERKQEATSISTDQEVKKKKGKCFECGIQGHWAKDCLERITALKPDKKKWEKKRTSWKY